MTRYTLLADRNPSDDSSEPTPGAVLPLELPAIPSRPVKLLGLSALTWCAILLLIHALAVSRLFSRESLVLGKAVVDTDYGLHYYRAEVLRESNDFPGLVWDPSYMAGYPVGGMTDVDNRLGELGVWLLRKFPSGFAWNWTLLALFATVPLWVFLAARGSGLTQGCAVIAAFLSTLVFWSMRTYYPAFVEYGMYGWVMASALIPLWFVCYQRALENPSWRTSIVLGLIAALAGWAHALAALMIPWMILIALARWRTIRLPAFLCIACSVLIAALLVYPIARPVLQMLWEPGSDFSGHAVYFQSNMDRVIQQIKNPIHTLSNALFLLVCFALLLPGVNRGRRELAAAALATAAFAFFEFLVPGVDVIQPLRFVAPALFLATIPAADLVGRSASFLYKRAGLPERMTALALFALLCWPFGLELLLTLGGARTLAVEPSADARELITAIHAITPQNARVMMEDDGTGFGGNHFGSTHLVAWIAREVDREFIGGPYPVTPCPGQRATFMNGTLVGKDVQSLSNAEIKDILTEYNVGTVVVWSERSKERFAALGLPESSVTGGFAMFRSPYATGFASGSPDTKADAGLNVIRVTGASTSPTLLRWQYDRRFQCRPELKIESSPSSWSDPGFILVHNGSVTSFELEYVD